MANNPTHFQLIRHAHIDTGPPPGLLCGSFDLPLSRRGWDEIRLFQSHGVNGSPRPELLYTSPLRRARTTAGVLGEIWGLQPAVEPALAEIHCGMLEGSRIVRIQREFPEIWARNEAQADDDFGWPGGETYRAFRQRVLACVGRLARQHPGRRVALITHSGVITQLIGQILRRPAAVWNHHRPAPFSATEVLWSDGSPQRVAVFDRRQWWQ
jgi:2,3-bisphosphoglycerate-dependent phosphoglycerate mutase